MCVGANSDMDFEQSKTHPFIVYYCISVLWHKSLQTHDAWSLYE